MYTQYWRSSSVLPSTEPPSNSTSYQVSCIPSPRKFFCGCQSRGGLLHRARALVIDAVTEFIQQFLGWNVDGLLSDRFTDCLGNFKIFYSNYICHNQYSHIVNFHHFLKRAHLCPQPFCYPEGEPSASSTNTLPWCCAPAQSKDFLRCFHTFHAVKKTEDGS